MILDSSEIVKLWHRLHVSESMLSYFKESFCRYHKTNSEYVKCIRQLIQLALVCLKNTWVLFFLHEIIPIFYVKTSNNLVFFYVIKGSRGIHLFIILLFKSTGRMMWILKNAYVQTHTHLPTFTDSPQSYLLVNFFLSLLLSLIVCQINCSF